MKAWWIDRHGGSEVLKTVELPKPEPGPSQVRVKIKAIGLNHLDVWVRKGVAGHQFPLPLIPGSDGAGVIDGVGTGAKSELSVLGLSEGSEVVINPGESCGKCSACISDHEPLCQGYEIHGESRNGCATEWMILPTKNVLPKPKSLTFVEAAAIPIPYITAWSMVVKRAQLKRGELILIHAGGSGVSIAATQIAKNLGATVITTVGDASKVDMSKRLGADHVILYKEVAFREELKKILPQYGKKGADVIVDHVGQDTFAESMKALTWGGRLVTCGATTGGKGELNLHALFFKNLTVHGVTMGSRTDLKEVLAWMESARIRPVIDQVGDFSTYPQMLERLESHRGFGKMIVECSSSDT